MNKAQKTSKVKKELLRIVKEFPADCDWDDVIFALHMQKIMAPGYKTKNDSMVLPTREIMDSWIEEIKRREKNIKNGKAKWLSMEEAMATLKNGRKKKVLKRLPGFPKLTVKQAMMETAANLPDHCDWDEAACRFQTRKKIEEALQAIREGDEYDHDEVFKELEQ